MILFIQGTIAGLLVGLFLGMFFFALMQAAKMNRIGDRLILDRRGSFKLSRKRFKNPLLS